MIKFHQPRFPWNKRISLPQLPFTVKSCEVAIIWPNIISLSYIARGVAPEAIHHFTMWHDQHLQRNGSNDISASTRSFERKSYSIWANKNSSTWISLKSKGWPKTQATQYSYSDLSSSTGPEKLWGFRGELGVNLVKSLTCGCYFFVTRQKFTSAIFRFFLVPRPPQRPLEFAHPAQTDCEAWLDRWRNSPSRLDTV